MADLQSFLDKTYPASFNGVPFLLESDSSESGKLTTTHLYPFKNYSYTEELGNKLRTFSIKAIVAGENYEENRDILIAALRIKGTGILIHPFYGMVTAICTGFKVSHEMKELGIARLELTFEESLIGIFPSSIGSTLSSITSLASSIISNMNSTTSNASSYSINYPQNINSSATKCETLNETLNNNVAMATNIDKKTLNDFNVNSGEFTNNTFANVEAPKNLGSSITTLINNYNDIGGSFLQSYLLCAQVFEFGNTDKFVSYGTFGSDERIKNAKTLNSIINATLLVNLYENAAMISYLNTQQLNQVKTDLESRYQWFLNNNSFTSSLLRSIEQLRTSVTQYLNGISVTLDKVIEQPVTFAPLTPLLYQYYSNFTYEQEIINLNTMSDVTNIIGPINLIATQQG